MSDEQAAYEAGKQAYWAGAGLEDCPYHRADLREAWEYGWVEAEQQNYPPTRDRDAY